MHITTASWPTTFSHENWLGGQKAQEFQYIASGLEWFAQTSDDMWLSSHFCAVYCGQ